MRKDNFYRPIELVHDFKFIPCTFDQTIALPSPKERLERLKRLGYGGVALCPNYGDYLSRESFRETIEIIKYAKELDLLVWIYDEMFYPSGSAGGIIPRQNPSLEAKAIAIVSARPDDHGMIFVNSPHGYGEIISAYLVKLDSDGKMDFDSAIDISKYKTYGGGIVYDCKENTNSIALAFFPKTAFEFCTTSHNTRGVRRYIDTLDKKAVDAFLDKTFGGYESLKNLGDFVESVFSDEPQIPGLCRQNYRDNYLEFVLSCRTEVFRVLDIPDKKVTFTPYLPWTDDFPKEFRKKHGYDVIKNLPRLFLDESKTGDKIRADYWQTASDLFAKNFGENYLKFAKKKGVKYSGHFLYEENFDKHPYMHGDLLAQLSKMDIPGSDMLYASPENILKNSTAIKFASSTSDLYGKEDVMIEASNILKDVFPITPLSYALATAIQTALGVTRFLSYYTDFIIPEEEVKKCTDFTARLLRSLSDMKPIRRVFVYVPNRYIFGKSYPSCSLNEKRTLIENSPKLNEFMTSISETLLKNGIDFNFINDEKLSSLSKEVYLESVLVLPNGINKPVGASKFNKIVTGEDANTILNTLTNLGYKNVETEKPAKFITLRKKSKEKEAFLIVNIGDDYKGKITLNTKTNKDACRIYDPFTDKKEKATFPLELTLDSGKCKIIIL